MGLDMGLGRGLGRGLDRAYLDGQVVGLGDGHGQTRQGRGGFVGDEKARAALADRIWGEDGRFNGMWGRRGWERASCMPVARRGGWMGSGKGSKKGGTNPPGGGGTRRSSGW